MSEALVSEAVEGIAQMKKAMFLRGKSYICMRNYVAVFLGALLFLMLFTACVAEDIPYVPAGGEVAVEEHEPPPFEEIEDETIDEPSLEDDEVELPPLSEDRIYRAAFISPSLSLPGGSVSPIWTSFQQYMGEYGFEMYVFPGDISLRAVDEEIEAIEMAVTKGMDAIFISPSCIVSIVPALEKAKEAGLIVGMFMSELPPEYHHLRDFWVGSDDYSAGKQAGEFVAAAFPEGANFVEVGGWDGHNAQIKRHDGFRAGIEGSNIVELDSQNCTSGWFAQEAMTIMENFIAKYGNDIDIVFCHWDNGASGVIEALHNAGMHDVFVIGMDGNSTGYYQVKDGHQWLSVGQNFTGAVKKSLENAKILLEGGTVPEENIIPWDMVTLETINSFPWPEW